MISTQIATLGLALTGAAYDGGDYDKLLELFNASNQKPRLETLGKYGENAALNPWTCVIAEPGKGRDSTSYTTIEVMDRTVKGVPDRGPLLPGTPDHIEKQLVFGGEFIESRRYGAQDLTMYSTEERANEWVGRVSPNNKGIFSDVGGTVELPLRQNGAYLTFVLRMPNKATGTMDTRYAGYCFRDAGAGCEYSYETPMKVLPGLPSGVDLSSDTFSGHVEDASSARATFLKACNESWDEREKLYGPACEKEAGERKSECLAELKAGRHACVSNIEKARCRRGSDGGYFHP